MAQSNSGGIHPVSLTFTNSQYEESYGDWSFPRIYQNLWDSLVYGPFSTLGIFGLDCVLLGRFEWLLFFIRVVLFPALSLVLFLALRFGKKNSFFHLNMLYVVFFIGSHFLQFWAVIEFPGLGPQYLLILTLLAFSASVTAGNLIFKYLLPLILFVLAAFIAKIILLDSLSTAQLVYQSSMGIMFSAVCLTAGYMIERSMRISFYNRLELEKNQKELLSKNRELEQFAYIASHDLQEPLRSITSFSQLLNEDYRARVGAEGGQYIDFVLEASTRMRSLIQGLLDYSRLGGEATLVKVDSKQLLASLRLDLSTAIAESNTTITAGDLPTVTVYETEFRQLLQNLLSNAIKFRKPGVQPEIHIDCQKKGNFWEFSVKDNGIGIAPEHQEKIFLIFQRLHNRSLYEGTGIGLANVRKIVELHGGQISVQSKAGEGSTFIFTIPVH